MSIKHWLVACALVGGLAAKPAQATIIWDWSYTGVGISAAGTFTTADTPDGSGDYLITAITGQRNGVAITGLTPTGTANPGNEPYAVDNLVAKIGAQLTGNGFGFSLADGTYANPFYYSGYSEYLSVPPYAPGAGPEVPIQFSAAPVPEPASWALMMAGFVGVASRAGRRRLRFAVPPKFEQRGRGTIRRFA